MILRISLMRLNEFEQNFDQLILFFLLLLFSSSAGLNLRSGSLHSLLKLTITFSVTGLT
ncbi:MAG: DUF4209 domain-containing protein [Candidatus Altimarinota bacterium]